MLLNEPTILGAHTLSMADRIRLAEMFQFRLFVSDRFDQRACQTSGYHQFVTGKEALLWDDFRASRARAQRPPAIAA